MSNPGLATLVSYWPLDELLNQRLDKSGVDLTLWTPVAVTADAGKRGRAAKFDAATPGERLRRGSNFWHKMDNLVVGFEMGCWVKPATIPGTSMRIMNKWTTGGEEYLLYLNGINEIRFLLYDGSSIWTCPATNFGPLSVDTWYYVACYYDVINYNTVGMGVAVNDNWNTITGPGTSVYTGYTTDFSIGMDGDSVSQGWDGLIDEAFIYRERLLTAAERTWMYNLGHGRTYEDLAEVKPPVTTIETGLTIGNLPIHVFDTSLKQIGIIEDYYSLSWAERFNDVGDFELEVPITWESNSLIDFQNFLYIKSSDRLMIIEEKKVSMAEDKASLVITGQSAESLLKRRVLEHVREINGPGQIAMYSFILNNFTKPAGGDPLDTTVDTDREITLFSKDLVEMIMTTEFDDVLEEQVVYDAMSLIAKASGFGFKVICADLEAADPKLSFVVYEGVDRSYAQSANIWVVFADKFENVMSSSFFSTERDSVTCVYVITDAADALNDKSYVWLDEDNDPPADLARVESVLDTGLDYDATDPPLSIQSMHELIHARGFEVIKASGPFGLLEGDFDTNYVGNHYGEHFYMGDIIQCNLHGIEVGARVIELVRSYSAEGEKTYLGLDFIML